MRIGTAILGLTLAAMVAAEIPVLAPASAHPSASRSTISSESAAAAGQRCAGDWRIVDVPQPNGSAAELTGVSVLSRRDVRFHGSGDFRPLDLRWNGSSMTAGTPLPVAAGTVDTIASTSYSSASDGWAMINTFVSNHGRPVTARWHAGRWTHIPTAPAPDPTTTGIQLGDLEAVSASEAWAVGGTHLAAKGIPAGLVRKGALIERWDGISWQIVDNPASDQEGTVLSAIEGLSADDIWAVGYQLVDGSEDEVPLIEHYDGSRWRTVPAPSGNGASGLYAIDAISPTDIWAVGAQTAPGSTDIAVPLVMHWDGTDWTVVPNMPDVGNAKLTTVHASSAGVWATGAFGGPQQFLHWNGTSWSAAPAPGRQQYGVSNFYYELAGTDSGEVWAAGQTHDSSVTRAQVARFECGRNGR